MTLPSVRSALFIPGVSWLSFIVAALSFLSPVLFRSLVHAGVFIPRSFSLYLRSPFDYPFSYQPKRTSYILALTYSGLMPVVFPAANFPSHPFRSRRCATLPFISIRTLSNYCKCIIYTSNETL